jgi:hypothetical protein
MKLKEICIFGNNFGAIIAAIELSKKYKINIVNPTNIWGAHFSGIKINDIIFDVGMNFFELSSFQKSVSDIKTYDISKKNDSARFLGIVSDYLKNYVKLSPVRNIYTFYEGNFYGDFLISNCLDIIENFSQGKKYKILDELNQSFNVNLHASKKYENENLFKETSFYEVGCTNHSQFIHEELIEPFCKKIFNLDSKLIPALFHRVTWMPLYYPETIKNSILDCNFKLPVTEFHYPTESSFSDISWNLYQKMLNSENINVIHQNPDKIVKHNKGFSLEFGKDLFNIEELIWFGDLIALNNLIYNDCENLMFKRSSFTLVFIYVKNVDLDFNFSCIYDVDDKYLFRITNQDSLNTSKERKRIILEYNSDILQIDEVSDTKLGEYSLSKLISTKILREGTIPEFIEIKKFKNAVVEPSFENFNLFNRLKTKIINDFPDINLMGPSSGFSNSSLTDLIVQAIYISKKL